MSRTLRATRALSAMLAIGAWLALHAPSRGEEPYEPPRPTHNLFGMTGLIDTPSADVQPDGQLTFTTSFFGGFLRNTLSAQLLPGIEGAFRYSALDDSIGTAANPQRLFDRSFDIKLRLAQETKWFPAVAIGLQDFLGTGIYSSEYVVATKGVDAGDFGSFRISAGLGWGRFADRSGIPNPLRGLDDGFGTRDTDFGFGGNVNFGQYFRGRRIGVFGGVEWQTPIDDLTAKVEYSGDQYVAETRDGTRGDFEARIPVNLGLQYRVSDGVEIGAYYMYGTEFGIRLSLSGNPFRPLADQDIDTPPQPLLPREPLPNGARIAGLGDVRTMVDGKPAGVRFADPRLDGVVVHTRLGDVRWVEAKLAGAGGACPDDLARAIDAEYGVIDVVTFRNPGGSVLCTVALRPKGQHAVRLVSRVHAEYPTDWYDQEEQRKQLIEILAEGLAADQIGLLGIEIGPRRVELYIENGKYFQNARAIGRTARVLTRTMPASVEVFEITPVEGGLPISTVILNRSQLEDQVDRPDAARRSWATAQVKDAKPVAWGDLLASDEIFPRFEWSVVPVTPVSLFDPEAPFRIDLSVQASGTVEFMPGLSATAVVQKRIVGQLDEVIRGPGSAVENRVRSEIAQYLSQGDPALIRLSVDYVTKFSESLYGRISGGLLERMFAGVSGEVLWKPADQSWGLGLELNYVVQRDFDTLFSLQDYRVLTGHASIYWDTDFYGIAAQVDLGRYLAGDWGGTLSVKRRFANGWELGGFFTLTTIPFDEFGEGSFDRGIFLNIPFNWFSPFDTRRTYPLVLRPLTRDGGARLDVGGRLYPTIESADRGALRNGWEEFWD